MQKLSFNHFQIYHENNYLIYTTHFRDAALLFLFYIIIEKVELQNQVHLQLLNPSFHLIINCKN